MPLSLSVALSLAGLQSSLAADYCECKYSGKDLPDDLINNYPSSEPGKYNVSVAKHVYKYGTMCGVWDAVTGTPGKMNYGSDKYFVHFPWCYVDASCTLVKAKTHLWDNHSDLYYSYEACGAPHHCFDGGNDTNCTAADYDPTGTGSNREYKQDCPCKWYGEELPEDVWKNHPNGGTYKDLRDIAVYGTTCASWDTAPHQPWSSDCSGVELCAKANNWCQIPWCYVDDSCSSAQPTQVFQGAEAHSYSHDTCMGVPDCYTGLVNSNFTMPATCPFHAGTFKANVQSSTPGDKDAMMWAITKRCTAGWVEEDATTTTDGGSVRAALTAGTLALVMMVMG